MSNLAVIEQILTKLLVNETVDGLWFWGPKLLFSTDTNHYDEVFICIEGTCTITEQDRVTTIQPSNPNKLQHLCTLSYQKISSVKIVEHNNFLLHFKS